MPDLDRFSLSGPKPRLLRKYQPINCELYFYCRLRTMLLTSDTILTCSTCQAQLSESAPFCPRCGASPRKPLGFSYTGSILFAITLFFIIFIWWASLNLGPATQTKSVVQDPPNETATVIARCGMPDTDKTEGVSTTTSRSLTYRKAHVTFLFVRALSGQGWKLQSTLDSRTLKPITPERMAKRLPCLSK